MVKDFSNKMLDLTHQLEELRFKNKNEELRKKLMEVEGLENDIKQLAKEEDSMATSLGSFEMGTLRECQQSIKSINGLKFKCERLQKNIEREKNRNDELEMSIKFLSEFLNEEPQLKPIRKTTLPRLDSKESSFVSRSGE